jgi:uncharacterized protein YacL
MTLSKNQKFWIGVLHFLPLIGIIFYFIFFFTFFINNIENLENQQPNTAPTEFIKGFLGAVIILIISVLISIGVKIFDIIHLTKNNKNDTNNKILMWVLLFVFVGTIAEIIYYFIEILPKKENKELEIKE